MSYPRIGAVRRYAIRCCMAAMLLVAVGGCAIQSTQMNPGNARLSNYLHDVTSPRAVAGVVGGGLVSELRNKNDAVGGLGGRIGSNATHLVVTQSFRHGFAALMHRSTDYQYHFCDCHGFGPRVGHAFLETFTDRREDGSRAFSVPRIAGAYAGAFAGLAWDSDRNAGDAMVGATISLGFSALLNIARELTGIGR